MSRHGLIIFCDCWNHLLAVTERGANSLVFNIFRSGRHQRTDGYTYLNGRTYGDGFLPPTSLGSEGRCGEWHLQEMEERRERLQKSSWVPSSFLSNKVKFAGRKHSLESWHRGSEVLATARDKSLTYRSGLFLLPTDHNENIECLKLSCEVACGSLVSYKPLLKPSRLSDDAAYEWWRNHKHTFDAHRTASSTSASLATCQHDHRHVGPTAVHPSFLRCPWRNCEEMADSGHKDGDASRLERWCYAWNTLARERQALLG